MQQEENLRLFGVAELCPLDLDRRVCLPCLMADFRSDMLSFSITISPDEQCFRRLRQIPNVPCNCLLVLPHTSAGLLTVSVSKEWIVLYIREQ